MNKRCVGMLAHAQDVPWPVAEGYSLRELQDVLLHGVQVRVTSALASRKPLACGIDQRMIFPTRPGPQLSSLTLHGPTVWRVCTYEPPSTNFPQPTTHEAMCAQHGNP